MINTITKNAVSIVSMIFIVSLCSCSGAKRSSEIVKQTTAVQTTQQVNTSQQSTTQEPTTEKSIVAVTTTVADSSKWKESYKDYIFGLGNTSGNEKYDLIDLDNDGIPELFCDSGIDLGGGTLISFYKNSINTINTGSGGITYSNNRMCSVSGRQGIYETKVFEVSKDGSITEFDEQYSLFKFKPYRK